MTSYDPVRGLSGTVTTQDHAMRITLKSGYADVEEDADMFTTGVQSNSSEFRV